MWAALDWRLKEGGGGTHPTRYCVAYNLPSTSPSIDAISPLLFTFAPSAPPMLLSSPRLLFAPFKVKPVAAQLQPAFHKVRGVIFHSRFPSAPVFLSQKACFGSSSVDAEMETVDTGYQLSELRRLMRERNLDIYSQSTQSKPPRAAHWKRF